MFFLCVHNGSHVVHWSLEVTEMSMWVFQTKNSDFHRNLFLNFHGKHHCQIMLPNEMFWSRHITGDKSTRENLLLSHSLLNPSLTFFFNIFETLIFNQLYFLASNILLSQHQSGFRKHFSTSTALMKFTSDILMLLMCVTFVLDFSKALDLVDHYLLVDTFQLASIIHLSFV